jgi:hypothetical protein
VAGKQDDEPILLLVSRAARSLNERAIFSFLALSSGSRIGSGTS